ncbi:MAG: peptidoglycan-binding protein [Sphingobacteriales bacterium]|nr:peptidoglycan-binding protein [Sphingobacteriales bacterium]
MLALMMSVSAIAQSVADDLPPNPEYGKCYAKCKTADVYETTTERVLVKEEGSRVLTEPARYENGEERILAKEASQRIEVIPATYETVSEQILVKPAGKKLIEVPAKYDNVTEQILVSPETGRWVKKKVDPACLSANPEDCMVQCWEKVPAQYKTITKRVTVQPATTQEVEIPAEYKTVTKQVIKTPATTRVVDIPAEYKTITTKKLVSPATSRTESIPAEYKDVTKRNLVRKGEFTGWQEVLCAAKTTDSKIMSVQRALQGQGYDPGPIDGVMGSKTKAALTKFQTDKGLSVGNMSIETLKALGVDAN